MYFMKKHFLFIFLLLVFIFQGFSQSYQLKGTVKDTAGNPIPFTQISTQKLKINTFSDLDGTFSLSVSDTVKFPYSLLFFCAGMKSKSFQITAQNKESQLRIVLEKIPVPKSEKEAEGSLELKTLTKEGKSVKYKESKTFEGTVSRFDKDVESRDEMRVSEVIIADGVAPIAPKPGTSPTDVSAGRLTAGELNDFSKWTLWEDIAKNILADHQKAWKVFPNERYVAQLTNSTGMPIVDAAVYLQDKNGNTIWQARTDNTGKAELWANVLVNDLSQAEKPYKLLFSYQGKTTEKEAIAFPKQINTAQMDVACSQAKQVDIDFIVDATGSMGDEIRFLQAELYDVISNVQQQNRHIDLRIGSTFYRDFGDEYLTRSTPLDKDIKKTIDFMKLQNANGGGDTPEAVDEALTQSIEKGNWSSEALTRIAFLVLDAPPHLDSLVIQKMHRQIYLAAMKGIRIVPIVCSGADKSTEYLMRSIALATNGTYVFLTDDSGIGNPHMKPTTDKYDVEKLNHIMMRVISEFCRLPQCDNNWDSVSKDLTQQEKFLPKPYDEKPKEGTERLNQADVFKIYPNPCNGTLHIELLKNITELYVMDVSGKALQRHIPESLNTFSVNLQGYASGVYFIRAFCEGRWYMAKFILTK